MPYIPQDQRGVLEEPLTKLLGALDYIEAEYDEGVLDGALNYVISKVLHETVLRKERYLNYARAVAALECAKLELYTRHARAYEDKAIERNGDL